MIYHEKDIKFEAITDEMVIFSDKDLYKDIFDIQESVAIVRRILTYDIVINYEPLTNVRFQYA